MKKTLAHLKEKRGGGNNVLVQFFSKAFYANEHGWELKKGGHGSAPL